MASIQSEMQAQTAQILSIHFMICINKHRRIKLVMGTGCMYWPLENAYFRQSIQIHKYNRVGIEKKE